MDNKALGKGLSALIPLKKESKQSLEEDVAKHKVSYMETSRIHNNTMQPRTHYDPDRLLELKKSIADQGILQPILVRAKEDHYEVVAGERRLRAARDLGLKEVPVIEHTLDDQETLVIALIENLQREDLDPIEEAEAYQVLLTDFEYTQEEIAESVGKNRSTVTNMIRLLKLSPAIRDGVSRGKISMGHARTLLSIESPDIRDQFYRLIIEKSLSVRELESLIRTETKYVPRKKKKEHENAHEIKALEEELQGVLGTKVSVEFKKKRGKVIIEYYSLDDLDRIIGIMKNE